MNLRNKAHNQFSVFPGFRQQAGSVAPRVHPLTQKVEQEGQRGGGEDRRKEGLKRQRVFQLRPDVSLWLLLLLWLRWSESIKDA